MYASREIDDFDVVLFQIYWSVYLPYNFTVKHSDKVTAKIKWCSFFVPKCTV